MNIVELEVEHGNSLSPLEFCSFKLAICPFAAAAMPVGAVETVHVRSPLKDASTAFHTAMFTVKMHP